MLTELELQRIEDTKLTTLKSNCIGTILYICGAIEKDEYVDYRDKKWSKFVENYLGTLTKINTPKTGSLIVVRSRNNDLNLEHFIDHMGIIINDHPLLLFNRLGVGHKTSTEFYSDFIYSYNFSSVNIECYSRDK